MWSALNKAKNLAGNLAANILEAEDEEDVSEKPWACDNTSLSFPRSLPPLLLLQDYAQDGPFPSSER